MVTRATASPDQARASKTLVNRLEDLASMLPLGNLPEELVSMLLVLQWVDAELPPLLASRIAHGAPGRADKATLFDA